MWLRQTWIMKQIGRKSCLTVPLKRIQKSHLTRRSMILRRTSLLMIHRQYQKMYKRKLHYYSSKNQDLKRGLSKSIFWVKIFSLWCKYVFSLNLSHIWTLKNAKQGLDLFVERKTVWVKYCKMYNTKQFHHKFNVVKTN